ncbi:MAG: hypothetical protein AAB305_05550 [Candidatus Zixiibacteriota bacterium]
MVNQLLPQPIDNTYRGHKLALWLFALVVSVKALQGLVVIFNGYYVAGSADGIPLDTYAPEAAQTVVALFALTGFSRLVISLLCVLALVRYRSAIPFMFALQIFDYLARLLILHFVPIVRTGTEPGPVVNLMLFALMIVGLGLSLWSRGKPKTRAAEARR